MSERVGGDLEGAGGFSLPEKRVGVGVYGINGEEGESWGGGVYKKGRRIIFSHPNIHNNVIVQI